VRVWFEGVFYVVEKALYVMDCAVVFFENSCVLVSVDQALSNTNTLLYWELDSQRRRGPAPLAFFYSMSIRIENCICSVMCFDVFLGLVVVSDFWQAR